MTGKLTPQAKNTTSKPAISLSQPGILQRQCDCGGMTGLTGECEECSSKKLSGQRGTNPPALPNNPPDDQPTLQMQRANLGGHSFSSLAIESRERLGIQTKLTIGQPGDKYEQEADRVADQVMRMPDEHSVVARTTNLSYLAVDSQPPEEIIDSIEPTEEDQPNTIQRKTNEPASQTTKQPVELPNLSESIDTVSRLGGQPLPSETRKFMETRFGYNFGNVHIHIDPFSGKLARQIQSRAFTTGNHIFFAPGEFQPNQSSGSHLLAHELAHVVQQNSVSQGINRQIQRTGNGSLNCPPYSGYDSSRDLTTYNCAGLAHRTYDYKSLTNTRAALARGTSIACGTPCDHVGVVKHWLWEYDVHLEDSRGGRLTAPSRDFHTVGGPTDGDPVAKDSDEFYTKNGARRVYGPATAPSFRPATREQALSNDPAETPAVDPTGQPIYKVRSNFTESCYCLPCPRT